MDEQIVITKTAEPRIARSQSPNHRLSHSDLLTADFADDTDVFVLSLTAARALFSGRTRLRRAGVLTERLDGVSPYHGWKENRFSFEDDGRVLTEQWDGTPITDISFTIFARGSDTAFSDIVSKLDMNKLLSVSLAVMLAQAAAASPAPEVTLRVTPERDYIYRSGPREVIVQVEIEARKSDDARRAPMNLCVVLDRSGSMEGAKIEKARQAAAMAVDKLGDDDIFSLVTYDNETDLLIPPERIGGRDHREELKARIHRIQPGGSTALHAGVVLGAKQVRRFFEKERVNRVILLSDGLANVGPSRTIGSRAARPRIAR